LCKKDGNHHQQRKNDREFLHLRIPQLT
jgi:hypothetical protein